MSEQNQVHRLTAKEERAIAKENLKITKKFEKLKKRRHVPESEYTTQMRDEKNVLEFDDLHTYFYTDVGVVKAVNSVTFDVPQGSTVGVVGESGCGKSVTSLSVMGLVQGPTGQVVSGEIRFKSEVFKTDAKGKYIPVYERNEKGEIIYDDIKDRHGNPVCDKNGNVKKRPRQQVDENGAPVWEKAVNMHVHPIRQSLELTI
jgi:ABC-type glutathione transport system ATPase component